MNKWAFLNIGGNIAANTIKAIAYEALEDAQSCMVARIAEDGSVLWSANASDVLRTFALDMAREAMLIAHAKDDSCGNYVQTAYMAGRMFAKGKITADELNRAIQIVTDMEDINRNTNAREVAINTVLHALHPSPTHAARFAFMWALWTLCTAEDTTRHDPRVIATNNSYHAKLESMLLELAP